LLNAQVNSEDAYSITCIQHTRCLWCTNSTE